jgi:CRISPR-associated Csx2 family protein
MRGYTLISSIGTGMYKKDGGYRKTKYQFPNNGNEYETSLFLEAILETKYRPISTVILAGTLTSSWDILIPNPENENFDFWAKIKEECENKEKGISDESIRELETKLPGWYKNIPFKISVHSHEFTPENVAKIFSAYLEIPDSLAQDTDILFDITHGFRSMPLLVFQSLQLNASKVSDRKIELIYGEYIEEEKISHVRDLTQYWDYYETSLAVNLFNEKLDGKFLSKKIEPFWESASKFLIRFSEIVDCNFSLQAPEALKQLKNALEDYSESGKLQWVTGARNTLADIYKKLYHKDTDKFSIAKTVWEYSRLLRKKNLITQAVIALQVVTETAIAEKYDPSKIGDYGWFNGYFDEKKSIKIEGIGDRELMKIRKKNNNLSASLGQIERLRNQIAHGGEKDKKGNYPHQANIKGILKNVDDVIIELFNELEKE